MLRFVVDLLVYQMWKLVKQDDPANKVKKPCQTQTHTQTNHIFTHQTNRQNLNSSAI